MARWIRRCGAVGVKGCWMRMIGRLLASTLLLLGGCASIVGSSSAPIAINSSPDQAKIAIRDENGVQVHSGVTPATVTLPKSGGYFNGRDYTVEFSKPGYASRSATITSAPNGWYIAGNLLFGGLIGWFVVDPLTGSMWSLSPDVVTATLPPEAPLVGSVERSADHGLKMVLLRDVDPSLRRHLVRVD